jgi:hypothetical protein
MHSVVAHSCQEDGKSKKEVLPGIEPGLPEDTDATQNPE